uniref:Uncharacterized protein n=1 Tax=Leersia perrieri TaxID=77586 RepID=A0A0D9XBY5_9ORYZ
MGWSVVDAYDDLLGVRTWIDDPGTSHAHGSTSGWTPYKNWSFVLKSLFLLNSHQMTYKDPTPGKK